MGIFETEDADWLERLRMRNPPPPAVCVETGTGSGTFTRLALKAFRDVYTVELSQSLVAEHHPGLAAEGANCWQGDSADIVPRLAVDLKEPVFWYLDAHWFNGGQDVAQGDLPLLSELWAIAQRPYRDVIVVDDVNCFGNGPQPEWEVITAERIAAFFPGALEVVQMGDQFVVYR